MQGPRDELLARAALARDEDVGVDGGGAARHGDGALHADALADDVVEPVAGARGGEALGDLLGAVELHDGGDEAAILVVVRRDGPGREHEAAVRETDHRAVEPLSDRQHRPEGRQARNGLEVSAEELGVRDLQHARSRRVERHDHPVRVAGEDAVADRVERHGELMQREALLLARPQAAEGERHVLGEQVGDGLVLLAELAAAAKLVGVEHAGHLTPADGDGDARTAEVLPLARRERGRRRPGARAPDGLLAHRAPLVGHALVELARLADRDEHPGSIERDHDAIGVEQLRRERGDDGRERRLVRGGVDVAEDVEQDAQAVPLEQGRADELDQIAHRLVEVAHRSRTAHFV